MSITRLLGITSENYNKMYWETKLDWFHFYNKGYQELQIALLNQSLHNFYDKKYRELENHFINHMLFFDTPKSKEQLIDLYVDITNEVYRFYPNALQSKIKKSKIINQSQFN